MKSTFHSWFVKSASNGSWDGLYTLSDVLNTSLWWFSKTKFIIRMDFDGQVWTEKVWTENSQWSKYHLQPEPWRHELTRNSRIGNISVSSPRCSHLCTTWFFKSSHVDSQISWETAVTQGDTSMGSINWVEYKINQKQWYLKIYFFSEITHSDTVSFPLKIEMFHPESTEI